MRLLCLIGFTFWGAVSVGQAQSARKIHYSAETGGVFSSGSQNPFWLRTNQYGTVPPRGSFGTLRFGAGRDYRPKPDSAAPHKSRFDWGFGLNAVTNVGVPTTTDNPRFLLPDAYVKIRFGQVEFFGGNRREVYGLGDTLLTSGFVAWSGNALPFPKIQVHTPDFIPLGFTKGLFALRGGFAHGWLTDTYIQGSYLHQKYLYGRLGKPHWRVRLYGGINHQVQWGGHADYLIGTDLAVDGKLPSAFKDYLSLLTGHYPDDISNSRYTGFDGTNRIGNHIGSYDIALEWNGAHQNWLLYHQHIYEDASGLALQNVPDGLTGLRFLNRRPTKAQFQFQRIVLEWLSTTNQSGPTFDPTARYQGGDNYFNHSQYIQGWSYRGHTLGTPFIAPRADFTTTVNDFIGGGYFPNNRVTAGYIGATGAFRQTTMLTARLSYSHNAGTYNQPYPQPFGQLSALLSAQWRLGKQSGTVLTTSLALDWGELFPNSFGSYIGLKKQW